MKENKKDILNLDETKELNTLSNDNICEIIEMAINDIKDLYDHMNKDCLLFYNLLHLLY